jgi:hypothetical protein
VLFPDSANTYLNVGLGEVWVVLNAVHRLISLKPVSRAFADHDPDREGFLHACAFVGTNPAGELITSGFPVIRSEFGRLNLRWFRGTQ